jgi:hypothetical protein
MNRHRTIAFSLIEVMVSMTLLSVIVIGLLVVFNHTTRALRAVNNMTDVAEGARATVSFVTRDFGAMAASGVSNTYNLYAYSWYWPPTTLSLPGGGFQSNVLDDVFFLTHENDRWSAIGYFIQRNQRSDGVGTLYRFDAETNGPFPHPNWFYEFRAAREGDANVHRITDGVVQFQITPFDARGRAYPIPTGTNDLSVKVDEVFFENRFLPAHVELEIGLMEPETVRKFNAINPMSTNAAQVFLLQQIGKMHLFRQRIAIRNHSQPPAFD